MALDAALGRLGIKPGVCTSSTRPANPFEGQVIYETDTNNIRFWSGSAWESNKGGIISSSAPTGAAAGDIWYDSDDGRAYIYYDDGSSQQWVEFGAAPSGSSITLASYADSAARTSAIPSPTEADLSYLQDTNSVEVYDGSAWKQLAVDSGGTYSPSHTNITVGNGTEVARYVQVNKLVFVTYQLTWGSTTSFSGNIEVGLPFTAVARAWGMGLLTDAGVTNIAAEVSVSTGANKVEFRPLYAASTFAEWNTVINATNPFTWTTSDVLQFSIAYEVA